MSVWIDDQDLELKLKLRNRGGHSKPTAANEELLLLLLLLRVRLGPQKYAQTTADDWTQDLGTRIEAALCRSVSECMVMMAEFIDANNGVGLLNWIIIALNLWLVREHYSYQTAHETRTRERERERER